MTRCKTKNVVHNVFRFAFSPHQTETRNALKAIVAIEQRHRNSIDSRRGSFKPVVFLTTMPSSRAQRPGIIAKKRVDLPSKLRPSLNDRPKVGSKQNKLTRIPHSSDSRQKKAIIPSETRATTPSAVSVTSSTSLSSSDSQALPKHATERTSVVAEMAKPKQSVSSYHPQYITYHLGEPCTLGALDHLLTCGHKVLTTQPEACSSNCSQPHSAHLNPRGIDEPFLCMACHVDHVKAEHVEKVSSFCAALEAVADATGKTDRETWIAEKVNIMEIAWRDLELEQLKTAASAGRFCHVFYIDEDYADLVGEALAGRCVRPANAETKATAPPKTTERRNSGAGNATFSPTSILPKSSPASSATSLTTSVSRPTSNTTSRLPRLLKSS